MNVWSIEDSQVPQGFWVGEDPDIAIAEYIKETGSTTPVGDITAEPMLSECLARSLPEHSAFDIMEALREILTD